MGGHGPVVTTGFVGALGLMFDITGAFFLAESFVTKRATDVARDVRGYWGGNPYQLASAMRQSVEARAGFACLTAGFVGQFLAYSSLVEPAPNRYPAVVVLVGVLGFSTAVVVVRNRGRAKARTFVSREFGQAIDREINRMRTEAPEKVEDIALHLAGALDVDREPAETTDAFADRVVALSKRWAAR